MEDDSQRLTNFMATLLITFGMLNILHTAAENFRLFELLQGC